VFLQHHFPACSKHSIATTDKAIKQVQIKKEVLKVGLAAKNALDRQSRTEVENNENIRFNKTANCLFQCDWTIFMAEVLAGIVQTTN
jgi:hypothetical protein